MLHIPLSTWTKILAAVDFDPKLEVSFFAKLRPDTDRFIAEDILIPPQDVGGGHADVDREGLDWLMVELIKRNENPADWRGWGHSHASMGTSHSGTDTATLKLLSEKAWQGFALGFVVNAARSRPDCWMVYKEPENVLPGGVSLSGGYREVLNLPVTVAEYYDPALVQPILNMMVENVTETRRPAIHVPRHPKVEDWAKFKVAADFDFARAAQRKDYGDEERELLLLAKTKGWSALTQDEFELLCAGDYRPTEISYARTGVGWGEYWGDE